MSLNRAMGRAWATVQVIPGLGRELADALRCARAPPARAFPNAEEPRGDAGLAACLTAPNLPATLR